MSDTHHCNIHVEDFDYFEHGGCPSCIEEWDELCPDDDNDGKMPTKRSEVTDNANH